MTDIVERLRDGFEEDELRAGRELMAEAADEIERLRAERDASNKAAAWCDKHKPSGGARGHCVICSGEALSAALSRISYLCGEPNEMECGPYDVHCDEDAVVEQVRRLVAECDALRADAERYRWLREHNASDGRIHLTYVGAAIKRATTPKGEMLDAAIDAAMANDPSK